MRGKEQGRSLRVTDLHETRGGYAVVADVRRPSALNIKNFESVEVRKLCSDAAEIFPGAEENRFDFGRRLLRERGNKIGATDTVLGQPRAHMAHEPGCAVRNACTIRTPKPAKQNGHGPSSYCIERRLEWAARDESQTLKSFHQDRT